MNESSRRLFGFIPERFEQVMALVILPPVEKLHCLVEAAILSIVFGSRESIRNGKGLQIYWVRFGASVLQWRTNGGNWGWINVGVEKMAVKRGAERKRDEFETSH